MQQAKTNSTANTLSRKEYAVHISELELAINYWRQLFPAPRDSMTLCKQASLLAEHYATMIITGNVYLNSGELSEEALAAYEEVYATLKAKTDLQKAA